MTKEDFAKAMFSGDNAGFDLHFKVVPDGIIDVDVDGQPAIQIEANVFVKIPKTNDISPKPIVVTPFLVMPDIVEKGTPESARTLGSMVIGVSKRDLTEIIIEKLF